MKRLVSLVGIVTTLSAPVYAAQTVQLEQWIDLFGFQIEVKSIRSDDAWVHVWQRVKDPRPEFVSLIAYVSYNCKERYLLQKTVIGQTPDGRRVEQQNVGPIYPEPSTFHALNLDFLCSVRLQNQLPWGVK